MMREIVSTIRVQALLVFGLPALVAAVILTIGILTPRSYEGVVVVSPVTNASELSGVSLAASVFGAGAIGGLHSTPVLVSRLARLDGVLLRVAWDQVDGQGRRVVDQLRAEAAGEVNDRDALAAMRKTVSSTADLQTGLVTISVVAKDSALVRFISGKMLSYTSAAFFDAMRTQASALKHAQDARVESARLGLANAENALLNWRKANRSSSQFADASLTQRRLERELSLAEQLYVQVATQREAAASRELEEAPALVVVDGLPSRLRTKSRGLLLLTILWMAVTWATVVIALVTWPRLSGKVRAAV